MLERERDKKKEEKGLAFATWPFQASSSSIQLLPFLLTKATSQALFSSFYLKPSYQLISLAEW